MKRSVIYSVLLLVLFFTFNAFSAEATFERKGEYGIGAINDVVVDGNYAYCASGYNGLFIFDISNPGSPSLISKLVIPAANMITYKNCASVFKEGNYAFVSYNYVESEYGGGVYIIDVSNPQTPSLKATINGENIYCFTVYQGYLYIFDYGSLDIYDISNPSSPALVSQSNIGYGECLDIEVDGDYAYIVSSTFNKLIICDVSDKSNPVILPAFQLTTDFAYKFVVSGDYIFLSAREDGVYAIDVSDKNNPVEVSHYLPHEGEKIEDLELASFGVIAVGSHYSDFHSWPDYYTLSYIVFYPVSSPQLALYKDKIYHYTYGLALKNNNIFIAARSMGLMTYKYDSSAFTFTGGYYSSIIPGGITIYGDYLYTGEYGKVSWIFDNSIIPNFHKIRTLGYSASGVFEGGIVYGDRAFCPVRELISEDPHIEREVLTVFDLSNPTNPVNTGIKIPQDYKEHNELWAYYVDGNFLYAVFYREGFKIYDITDLNNIRFIGGYESDKNFSGVTADGNKLALFGVDGMLLFDISDKSNPVLKSIITELSSIHGTSFFYNSSYFIALKSEKFLVADVSDISNPRIVSSLDVPITSFFSRMYHSGSTVYVVSENKIYVFDISDPENVKLECEYEENEGNPCFCDIKSWGNYLVVSDYIRGKLYTYKYLASSYKIITEAGEGGKVEPSGIIDVPRGDSLTVNIIPDEGYFIKDVVVDGVSVGRVESYTFENVSMSHSLKASFATSLPPEIRSTDASPESGNVPLKVNFTCDAYDPDGGKIVEYLWIIYGDLTDRVTTTDGNMSYVFTKPGTYHVSVYVTDDEGEVASSVVFTVAGERADIEAQQSSMIVPIPMPSSLSGKGLTISDCITRITNKFDNVEVNVQLKMLDNSNNVVSTRDFVIPANGQLTINPKDYSDTNFSNMIAVADNSVISSTTVKTENGTMSAYIDSVHCSSLYIPHIAEERDYWDSMMFLGNTSPNRVSVSISGNSSEFDMNSYASFVDLEQYMGEDPEESKTWGFIKSMAPNPFDPSPSSLTGFEFFVHNGTDGAGCELQGEGSKTLYIPHIPEETDIFWTGFAIVNVEDQDASVIFEFYKSDGTFVGSQEITIPANSKLKGLMSGLFPDYAGKCEWGIIKSDRKLVGIEIYGTAANAICGYNLPSSASCRLVLPDMVVGENLWSGIAITAPGESDTYAYVILYSKDGTKKAEKMETIKSKNRFKAVVSDYFSDQDVSIEDGDYIAIVSVNPVVAIIVNGDLDRKFMSSLVGR